MQVKTLVLAAALSAAPGLLNAQFDFHLAGRDVQVHSFASQGFAYSNDNNYLTMKTSQGSFAFTDGGVNISTQITDKFRAGAQIYDRNIGNLGNWRPTVDWALGDYRFKSWFGIRAGKVKTALGLFNDTQDMEFLHTWAILPQSMYALDLRASTIAHTGADVYGTFSIKKFGDVSYTGYVGSRPGDKQGGYRYGLKSLGIDLSRESGWQSGGDLRWNNPVKGLLLGASYMRQQPISVGGTVTVAPGYALPLAIDGKTSVTAFYAEYKAGNLTLDGEYRREQIFGVEKIGPLPAAGTGFDQRAWYVSAAYRVSRRLELGTYHSRFYPLWGQDPAPPGNHFFANVVTARVDVTRHWDIKVEGHFIDGYGSFYSLRGFYPQDNPQGLQPTTRMFVVRTGLNF